jgi:hypothetical protein
MAFKRLEPEDFIVSSDSVSSTVWSNNSPSLNTYFSSSVQTEGTSGPYYLSVYQTDPDAEEAAVQFQIAYANKNGNGGVLFDSEVAGKSPTTTIYGQYRTLVLEDENASFTWGPSYTGSEDNDFYVISIERARYKQSLLPGSLNLVLSSSNNNLNNLQLTDDSNMVTLPTYYGTMRAYQLISGSDGQSYQAIAGLTGNGYTPNSGSYGLVLPDIATILLNAAALDDNTQQGGGINIQTNRVDDTFGNNPAKLFAAISGSFEFVNDLPNIFELNSQETLTSDYVFIRARNSEYNYTENPSFISGSTGEVIYPYFINNPQTYPTTVGLYNDSNDLLAVAKLSRPIQKDFTKEALVRVKLDF